MKIPLVANPDTSVACTGCRFLHFIDNRPHCRLFGKLDYHQVSPALQIAPGFVAAAEFAASRHSSCLDMESEDPT